MSEENKVTTNLIEKKLLKKACDEYCGNLRKAAENFESVFNSFKNDCSSLNETDSEYIKKFFKSIFYHTPLVHTVSVSSGDLPDVIKRYLLNSAVDEFIKTVEEVTDIVDGLS